MKMRVAALLLLGGAWGVFGQGSISFSNLGATDSQKVHVDSMSGPLAPAGTEYTVALFYAPDGITDDGTFTQLGAGTTFIGAAGTPSGLFNGGTRVAPISPPGGFAMFQVRAWTAAAGTTWSQALSGPGKAGKSSVFRMDTGDPSIPDPPGNMLTAGFQGFAVTTVPEPSAYGLAALGLGAFLLMRRRR